MSRSSKGFADFFPTAPSVLQQKKSRRQESSTYIHSSSTSFTAKKSDRGHGSQTNGVAHDHSVPETGPLTQDESELVQGDLLNGVGSASSTSTASSVFDAHNRQHDPIRQKRSNNTELTPFTSVDSSSPSNNQSPAHVKPDSSLPLRPESASRIAASSISGLPPTSMPSRGELPGAGDIPQSRGQIKGFKITYDPELDKTISSKERRSRQPQRKEFVFNVRSWVSPFYLY